MIAKIAHSSLLVSWGMVYVFIEVALITQIYFSVNKLTGYCSYIVLQCLFAAVNYESSVRYISIIY
jgi:hypothetical protein